MRAVIQRVHRASVAVNGETCGKIGSGLLVFLGVAQGDNENQLDWMVRKIVNMRIFPDEHDKMNRSAVDCGFEMLAISQFTLLADCRKGNRPNFMGAASPDEAKLLYEQFIKKSKAYIHVEKGIFGATMDIDALNAGPVTIIIET